VLVEVHVELGAEALVLCGCLLELLVLR
jgi:hypothetical protein